MVVDMGTHTLQNLPGQHLLVQLLAPGLEERARILLPLHSSHSTPGGHKGKVYMQRQQQPQHACCVWLANIFKSSSR